MELNAPARFGHHWLYSIPPHLVMGGLLVPGGIIWRAVHFHKHKPGWIIGLLDHVKPGDSRFPHTIPRVFDGGGLEGLDLIGFHMNKNLNDVHGFSFSGLFLTARNVGFGKAR